MCCESSDFERLAGEAFLTAADRIARRAKAGVDFGGATGTQRHSIWGVNGPARFTRCATEGAIFRDADFASATEVQRVVLNLDRSTHFTSVATDSRITVETRFARATECVRVSSHGERLASRTRRATNLILVEVLANFGTATDSASALRIQCACLAGAAAEQLGPIEAGSVSTVATDADGEAVELELGACLSGRTADESTGAGTDFARAADPDGFAVAKIELLAAIATADD